MSTVLITGGTGLIGTALSKLLLSKGYKVIILTRDPSSPKNRQATTESLSYAGWDTLRQTIDTTAIQQADYIINLAGAGVADKRWTSKRKQELVSSRVSSGQTLVKALQETPNKVKAVVNASGIGWYGADPVIPNPNPFKEADPADEQFLGVTCRQWEESIQPVTGLGKRLVIFRQGVVLSRDGGALPEFKRPVQFGIAAILGSGRQRISWIHIEDVCRMYLAAIENEKMQGVYNAVSPSPVSNKTFMLELAKQLKGKFYIPVYVPSFVLKTVLGEMSIEILKSATVSCEKIHATGFQFMYPSLETAIKACIKK